MLPKRIFTKKEIKEIIKQYESKVSILQIAKNFDVRLSPGKIYKVLRDNNVEMQKRMSFSEEETKNVLKMYEDRVPINHIAKKYEVHISKIHQTLRDNNIYRRPKKNSMTVLKQNKDKVLELFNSGVSQKNIANMFDCTLDSTSKFFMSLGIKVRPKFRITDKISEKINQLYSEGISPTKIAELCDIPSFLVVFRALKIKKRTKIEQFKLDKTEKVKNLIKDLTEKKISETKISSDNEEEILNDAVEMYKKGKSVQKIKAKYFISGDKIIAVLKKNNLKIREVDFLESDIKYYDDKILQGYKEGLSLAKIASNNSLSRHYVEETFDRLNLVKKTRTKYGIGSYERKDGFVSRIEILKARIIENKDKIFDLYYNQNLSAFKISKELNLNKNHIDKLIKEESDKRGISEDKKEIYIPILKYSQDEIKTVMQLYEEDFSYHEISQKLDIDVIDIAGIIRKGSIIKEPSEKKEEKEVKKVGKKKVQKIKSKLSDVRLKSLQGQILSLYNQNIRPENIAKSLKVKPKDVLKIINEHKKEKITFNTNLNDGQLHQIINLYNQKMSIIKISKIHNSYYSFILKKLKEADVKIRIEDEDRNKVNKETIDEAIYLHKNSFDSSEIAMMLDITVNLAKDIIKG